MQKFVKSGKIIILICILVFAIAAFLIGANFTYAKDTKVFYNKTYINGVDVSKMSVTEATDALTEDWNKHSFKFSFGDFGDEEVSLSVIGLTYNIGDTLAELMTDPSYVEKLRYFAKFKNSYEIDMPSNGNDDFVDEIADFKICDNSNREKTKDAYVDLSTKDFNVVKEVIGTEVDPKEIENIALECIEKGKFETSIEPFDAIKQPDVTANSLEIEKELQYAKDNLSYTLEYNFGSDKKVLTPKELNRLVKYTDEGAHVREGKVKDFVSDLADKYNEYGKTYKFKTHSGKVKKIQAVTFGRLLDEDAEIKYLTKALKEQKTDVHKPIWSQSPYQLTDVNDGIGDSYIEISISSQHVWFYKNGKLVVDCPCVSGGPGHGTPTGLYKVDWVCNGPMTLKGYNDDGSKYESPVNCFVPFNGGIGVHGADGWRGSYGGNIYQYNGSHGCVNCPDSAAKKIASNVEAGYPVVVY